MAEDYTEYLAINVLNEQQVVSYRLLSRALKVHVNLAKQMLYDFHRKQNSKKPDSVHATYLITGTKRVEIPPPQTNGVGHDKDGEDTVMQSSPLLPSSSIPKPDEGDPEPTFIRSLTLAKQEHLDQAKATFETISSIHIYSLEASSPADLQILTDCNRKVAADYASEDPLEAWKQYGTIQNANVKRRTRRTAQPPPPASLAKNTDVKTKPLAPTKPEANGSAKQSPSELEKKGATKPANATRQNSDIFKSFAKSNAKPKAEGQNASPAAEAQDEVMGGFSEDEADDDAPLDANEETEAAAPSGKSKRQREEELQAMMDAEEDDEEMDDARTPAADAEESQEPENTIDKAESPKADDEANETATVENGRRRGRRRVMKKKTVKDEEGYLVTKEEAVWESFSEDELPPSKKAKLPTAASAGGKPTATAAGKKSGGKPGQGNIMSFFGKK